MEVIYFTWFLLGELMAGIVSLCFLYLCIMLIQIVKMVKQGVVGS